jgi:hypothetical protein
VDPEVVHQVLHDRRDDLLTFGRQTAYLERQPG